MDSHSRLARGTGAGPAVPAGARAGLSRQAHWHVGGSEEGMSKGADGRAY